MHKKNANKNSDTTNRTEIGYWASLIYIALLMSYIIYKWSELACLPPNELGDFTAGAFGPLAILWLVLGYFQQGDELKQNTEALILQVTELKQSAQHQSDLVQVSREQVNADMARHRDESRKQKLKIQPRFSISWESDNFVNPKRGALKITNIGPECMDVYCCCDEEIEGENFRLETYGNYPILRRNEEITGTLFASEFQDKGTFHISITYDDSDDVEQIQTYQGTCYVGQRSFKVDFESYAEMALRTGFNADVLKEFDGATPQS